MKIIQFFIFIFLVVSCSTKAGKYKLYSETIQNSFNIDLNDFSKVIIIPNEGCTGCISGATSFVINTLGDSDSTAIIFTRIRDKKYFT